MNRFIRVESGGIFFIGFIFVLISSCERPPQQTSVVENDGKIALMDLEGKSIELADLEGKTIFLNFWATWCKPCIAEMPSIENAQQLLKNESIVFLLASNEPLDKIKKFKASQDFDLQFIQLTSPLEDLDIMALPTTFIISPSGEKVFSEMGGRAWDDTQNIQLLKKINDTGTLD